MIAYPISRVSVGCFCSFCGMERKNSQGPPTVQLKFIIRSREDKYGVLVRFAVVFLSVVFVSLFVIFASVAQKHAATKEEPVEDDNRAEPRAHATYGRSARERPAPAPSPRLARRTR